MTNREDEVADVVVIGSGPSGGVVTHTLAARGFRVVCLEQGDWVNPTDYPANYPEWELLIQKQWAHDPNDRGLPSDYPLDVSDSDMWPVMFNAVGGSSIYYGAEWPRLLPSDFRVRTLDGVADDWPITYADLAPYNDRIDAFIGVSGLGGDPAYPDGLDYPLPPHPLGKAGRKAAAGHECTRLALVARDQRHPQPEIQGAIPVRSLGNVRVGLPGKLEGFRRHRILAACPAVRRDLDHRSPSTQDRNRQ